MKKYGCTAPGNNPEARKKAKETTVKHLGVPYAMNSETVRAKSKQTLLEKYGVDNAGKSEKIKKKRHETNMKKYNGIYPFNRPESYEKQHKTIFERYGVSCAALIPYVQASSGKNRISKINMKFGELLSKNNIIFEQEFQIHPKIYDFKIKNFLIEINPTYTHNIIGNGKIEPTDKYYHRDKSQLAEDNGYRCIHVWDWDDWSNIVNMIKPPENIIYARKCTVYKINKNIGDEFLNKYYYKGTCRGQLLYLGLVYENELVEIMTFGKPRYDKHFDVELMRLCTKSNTRIIGGASKLFSYATSEYGLSNIISYCDRSKFSGGVYEKLGMKLIRTTPPQEIWSKGTEYITANLLGLRGYDQLFKTNYGKGVSNEELMLKAGWLPVYDCGQRVYAFK